MADGDTILRVYVQITTMRQHLSPRPTERDVEAFHAQLDRLDALGFAVDEFRVPENDLFRRVVSVSPSRGRHYATGPRDIVQGHLTQKMDALLGYFFARGVETPPDVVRAPIGFAWPKRS